jgi:hypothetical protein
LDAGRGNGEPLALRQAPHHGSQPKKKPISPSTHDLKYSLFNGRSGLREVGYDNERGKGDHRHFQGVETPYAFTMVEQLMADFWSDVHRLRGVQ